MRLKDLVNINTSSLPENTENSYVFKYIDISSISSDGEICSDEYFTFYDAPSRARRIVKKGDILVSTVRTYLMAIAPICFDAKDVIASTGFAVCTPKNNINSEYLTYAIKNSSVIDDICKESTGVSYPAITASRLSSINIPYANNEDQKTISDYLNEKIAEIDEQISLLNQKLMAYQRLKNSLISDVVRRGLNKNVTLKNSGVDWIGEIPAHWKVKRIKDVAELGSGTTPKSSNEKYYDDGIHPWLITGDVQNKLIESNDNFITDLALAEIPNLKLYPSKTVLLAMYGGGTIGNVGLMTYPAYINQACCAMVPKPIIFEKYLYYYLLTKQERIVSTGVGGTQINLSQNKISAYPISIPPLEEQQAIADYLDKKTTEIDNNISLINRKVKTYKLLKQSLIDEVVTGKRKTN